MPDALLHSHLISTPHDITMLIPILQLRKRKQQKMDLLRVILPETVLRLRACMHAQPCPTLCNPMDCSPPGSSVHGISQARILSVQLNSGAQSCPTLCNPKNHSTPGLPVHQQLPEFTQTHIHRVRDAIQPSHPLLSPSPPAPNPSQHQSLFQ